MLIKVSRASQVVLVVKNLPANAGDLRDVGSIPGLGRSLEVGNGKLLQYSCLENPMNRGAWWATVRGLKRVGHDGVTEPNRSMALPKEYSRVGENHWNWECLLRSDRVSLITQLVKNLSAMQETWLDSWVEKNPLEKG